jgi:transcriptional repressor NrdR
MKFARKVSTDKSRSQRFLRQDLPAGTNRLERLCRFRLVKPVALSYALCRPGRAARKGRRRPGQDRFERPVPHMMCPFCRNGETKVIDSRTSQDFVIRRRRECLICERRFTTYEKIEESPLKVIKKDGTRVPFDREKIRSGLEKACYKRPVSESQIEAIVCDVEADVYQNFDREVPSRYIGEKVFDRLRTIDQVAFVRFASVYREFKDVNDFVEELEPILRANRH